jgi:hypothetical protein
MCAMTLGPVTRLRVQEDVGVEGDHLPRPPWIRTRIFSQLCQSSPGCSPRSYIALAELESWLLLSLRLLNELTERRPSNACKLTSCSTKCLPA